MLTADQPESSIHDLFHEETSGGRQGHRDEEIAALKARLDVILEHVLSKEA